MSRKIGFWPVFALVTGSQIGSGVFMLPANLAPFGAISLVGWVVSGLGAMMLALVFAKLCTWFPRTGGPHVYVKQSFGTTASFFTGWTYWIISWVSTTVVISASIGYLAPLLSYPSDNIRLLLEIGLLMAVTRLNFGGVKAAGNTEFLLTLLKMIPLLIVPLVALFYFNSDNFAPLSTHSPLAIGQLLGQVTLLTMWGFIGVESATTPAGEVNNPSKTIPKAVILGTLTVAVFYFVNSIGIMGILPANELAHSMAPYADASRVLFGGNWHLVVSLIAAIVCVGTLNAWILTSGQIALGLSQDGLLPSFFGKKNQHGAPTVALLLSAVGMLPLLVLTLNSNLAEQINGIIDYSVTAFLFVYMMCTLAFLKQLWQCRSKIPYSSWLYGILALCFCAWVIIATPAKTLLISGSFVISGLPLYFYQKRRFLSNETNTPRVA